VNIGLERRAVGSKIRESASPAFFIRRRGEVRQQRFVRSTTGASACRSYHKLILAESGGSGSHSTAPPFINEMCEVRSIYFKNRRSGSIA
jgi:hypothetical protein